MRKENIDKQSGAAAILLQSPSGTLSQPSPSGLTRGSRDKLANWFDLDSRVKPENDSNNKGPENDSNNKGPENDSNNKGPENDRRKKEPENDRGGWKVDSRIKSENDNTFVKGCHGWKKSGGAAAVAAISTMFCFGAGEALAQCAVPPSCESLGYNLTSSDCEGKRALKCPFDASKVFCSQTKSEGIAVGNIYYSDGTISESVIAGKTPVGIVAYVNGKSGFAIALEEKTLKWSSGYNNLDCLQDLRKSEATGDMNGVQNTQCIMSQTNDTYPAAAYCNGYAAVSTGKGSKGWYLPAAGELHQISLFYTALNITYQRLSKTQLSPNFYWSSSEYAKNWGWIVRLSDGTMNNDLDNYKDSLYRVRCFLAF